MRVARAEMVAHLGGKPSATQLVLVDEAAWIRLHLAQLKAKTAAGHQMTEHDSRHYMAWSNSLSRLMRQLGLQGKAERAPSLGEYVAQRSAMA
ncbi:MAG: hypothetical protein ACRYGM_05220 [Janthinobacterium lividum]